MGQGKSKPLNSRAVKGVENLQELGVSGNHEGGSQEGSIPQERLLGKMLQFWDAWGYRRGKSKQKMIQYCMFEWTKEII